jgi:hypothetical protein
MLSGKLYYTARTRRLCDESQSRAATGTHNHGQNEKRQLPARWRGVPIAGAKRVHGSASFSQPYPARVINKDGAACLRIR